MQFRSFLPILAFAAGFALLSLAVTNSYYQLMLTLVLVWACFGLSWNVLSGYTGWSRSAMPPSSASAPMRPRSDRTISTCRPG